MPPFPSLTKTWHSETYDAINPTRPELAIWQGKVIVVTGGGGAIGSAIALSFAKAGSTKIALLGRRQTLLEDTKSSIEKKIPGTQVLAVPADLTSPESLTDAFSTIVERFGKVDVLVANAGYLAKLDTIVDSDPDDWWTGFEINTRGVFNLARAFLPNAVQGAVVINVSTCVVHMPPMYRGSSYVASKLGGTKIWEFVGKENPNIEVIHMHPGVVTSELNVKSGITPLDKVELPGDFAVWMVSPEAKKFRGKFLWCNWDVTELKERENELSREDQLTITMNGWPFGKSDEGDPLKF